MLAGSLLLASCISFQDPLKLATELQQQGQLQSETIPAGPFDLQVFHRGLDGNPRQLIAYIEGDGFAFRRRHLLSTDPTPHNPVALRLAAQDPAPAVISIARPCQYTGGDRARGCDNRFWSSHRYGNAVVDATSQALDWALTQSGAQSIGLVGYSGGGAIAALLASGRKDIVWLVTLAGNLDHRAWTERHQVSPLTGSLNPVDVAASTRGIPQLHLTGDRDDNISYLPGQNFRRQAGNPDNIRLSVVHGYDHGCCWQQDWPGLLCKTGHIKHPACTD